MVNRASTEAQATQTLRSLIRILAFPLVVLNMLGGIISGIWLATRGEWATIGYGIVVLIVAPYFLMWALLLPSMVFPWPMDSSSKRGKTLGMIVTASLGSVYRLGLMTTWCCGIFFMFVMRADETNFML